MNTPQSRRRFLRTLFCSSAALSLHIRPQKAAAISSPDGLHVLAIGDFGSAHPPQSQVARAMTDYCLQHSLRPEWLLLLGDNFYKNTQAGGGLTEARWKTGFEDMYPPSSFSGACPAILGNHDYHDTPEGERLQLEYHQKGSGRWTMPAKWYRLELADLATFLFIDTNLRSVSGKTNASNPLQKTGCLTAEEETTQWDWLQAQLASPRKPLTLVLGHHPVYSNGAHGDTPELVARLAPLLQKHRVPLYLAGHDHDLQHLELEGLCTSFVISGGGGAKIRALKNTSRKVPFAKPIFGFSHLHLRRNQLELRHLDEHGTLLHSFTKEVS